MGVSIPYTQIQRLPLKIVLLNRVNPIKISTLERYYDLRFAIAAEVGIGRRIFEFIHMYLAGTLPEVPGPVERVA